MTQFNKNICPTEDDNPLVRQSSDFAFYDL